MTNNKKPALVKIELVVFGVLLLVFMIWMSRRCTRTQQDYEAAAQLAEETADDTIYIPPSEAEQAPPASGSTPAQPAGTSPSGSTAEPEKGTSLYVSIEGLNMRSGPGLRYELMERFPLHTQLRFLGEVSPTVDTIKLGKITAAEPWVKVRSPKGRDGWVFGAGVSYYKRKIEVE